MQLLSVTWQDIEYKTEGVFDGKIFIAPINGFYYFKVFVCWYANSYLNMSM